MMRVDAKSPHPRYLPIFVGSVTHEGKNEKQHVISEDGKVVVGLTSTERMIIVAGRRAGADRTRRPPGSVNCFHHLGLAFSGAIATTTIKGAGNGGGTGQRPSLALHVRHMQGEPEWLLGS